MTIGEKIKKIRYIRSLTQRELAQKVGVIASQIKNYEIGFRIPKKSSLEKIANALKVGTTVLTDIDMTTLGDIKSILFQLDQKVGIQLIGEREENGKLKEGTISIAFDNEYIDAFLKEWADKQYEFESADKPTQEKALQGDVFDLGLDYEYETYTQSDSEIMVSKGHVGEHKDFSNKPDENGDT